MKNDIKFEKAIGIILEHEGGYVNDPLDRGGETKFGICKRSYPNVDVTNLTIEQAKSIYKRDFWDNKQYQNIESIAICNKIFDLSINMGDHQSTKLLQRALRAIGTFIAEDGDFGKITLTSVNKSPEKELLAALRSEAAGYYRALVASDNTQLRFLQGWLARAYN